MADQKLAPAPKAAEAPETHLQRLGAELTALDKQITQINQKLNPGPAGSFPLAPAAKEKLEERRNSLCEQAIGNLNEQIKILKGMNEGIERQMTSINMQISSYKEMIQPPAAQAPSEQTGPAVKRELIDPFAPGGTTTRNLDSEENVRGPNKPRIRKVDENL